MIALHNHLIPFDLPVEKWGAYYDARLVLVRALKARIPVAIFTAIADRQGQLDGDGCNLRFPINRGLESPGQAIAPALTSGVST